MWLSQSFLVSFSSLNQKLSEFLQIQRSAPQYWSPSFVVLLAAFIWASFLFLWNPNFLSFLWWHNMPQCGWIIPIHCYDIAFNSCRFCYCRDPFLHFKKSFSKDTYRVLTHDLSKTFFHLCRISLLFLLWLKRESSCLKHVFHDARLCAEFSRCVIILFIPFPDLQNGREIIAFMKSFLCAHVCIRYSLYSDQASFLRLSSYPFHILFKTLSNYNLLKSDSIHISCSCFSTRTNVI